MMTKARKETNLDKNLIVLVACKDNVSADVTIFSAWLVYTGFKLLVFRINYSPKIALTQDQTL